MAFGEGIVGFFSLFGGGWFGFLAKTKPETRGGEGTVQPILVRCSYFVNGAVQSFISTGISRPWSKYCFISETATMSKEFILKCQVCNAFVTASLEHFPNKHI